MRRAEDILDVEQLVALSVTTGAIAAAAMVGLDICGVDVVCDTVTRPLEEQGGASLR